MEEGQQIMGMWNDYKEQLASARLRIAELEIQKKALKKRAKKAEKLLAAGGQHRVVAPETKKAENIIQKLAESLDAGGGMTSASKLGSWRAARTAEYRSQQNALTMGPIGSLDDSDTN